MPSRDAFEWKWSTHFSANELRSPDYCYFIFSDDLLDRLELTYLEYESGYGGSCPVTDEGIMPVVQAFCSPFHLFAQAEPPPEYYENDAESPHLYGRAVDIQVIDCNENYSLEDDWEQLKEVAENIGGLRVDEYIGWPEYIHAYLEPPPSEPLVEVTMTPETVWPGWGKSRLSRVRRAIKTRTFVISGKIDPCLAENGIYYGQVDLYIDEVPFSGGWLVTGRPMIHETEPPMILGSSLTANNGEFNNIIYTDTCEWGGKIYVRAEYINGESHYYNTDTVDIAIPFLIDVKKRYPEIPGVIEYVGDQEAYNDHHNIDPLHYDSYIQIITDFRNNMLNEGLEVPEVHLNDISLPKGGRFVCLPPWWYNLDHKLHRCGCDADMDYEGWVYGSQIWTFMEEAILANALDIYRHDNHFHIYFRCRSGCP